MIVLTGESGIFLFDNRPLRETPTEKRTPTPGKYLHNYVEVSW